MDSIPDFDEPANVDEALAELAFTDILISTLDPRADDYTSQLRHLEAQKDRYQHALNTMRQTDPSARHDQPATNQDSWWQAAMDGRPGSTHSSSGASNGFTAPPVTNKRLRPQSSYLDPNEPNSKRHTPEPSNAGTPMSSDGSHDSFDRELSWINAARARQQAAEADTRRQGDTQQADAAFARNISQRTRTPLSGNASSSRPPVQMTLNHNGTFQRPPPVVKPEASSSNRTPHFQQPRDHGLMHRPQHVKAEPSLAMQQQLPQRSRPPPQIVDLTGSDGEDEDIAEIAPTSFTPSRRQPSHHPVPHTRPLYTPVSTTMQQPTTMHIPGAFPQTNPPGNPYGYGTVPPNGGMRDVWNGSAVYNSTRNGTNGITAPQNNYAYGSSSAQPFDLGSDDDDDDGDLIYGGARQIPGYGDYAGNEELYRSRYDALAAYDSTKTKEEIQALLQNIRPDEELPAHLRVQTPDALSVRLHKYQELGLTWLKKCEEGSNKGGVLADDMGLGKTIQMLSLMVTRKSDDPRCKTTLIIAPVALMRQWAQEIKSKLKPGRHQLTVFTHHGQRKAKSFQDLRSYDVVLTTYGSIASEYKKIERFKLRQAVDRDARPYPAERCVFLDQDALWYRVILDEAQCIKNRNTLTAKGTSLLNAKYRFCVTGTPMMNNVEEFYSLIKFLRIKPYSNWDKFRRDINLPLRSGGDDQKAKAMQMLQAVCKAVMLRRTKSSYFEGEPILVLPERSTAVDNPVFDEDEKAFYTALESQSRLEFNKYLKRGTVGTSYSAILVLLLRLRQACCHPHLIKDFGVASAADLEEDQMIEFAKQLAEPVVARIKETGGNFECPVCYDVTPNPAIFIPCGHDTCAECFSRIADTTNAIRNGQERADVKCPNCRSEINPKRLTDFNSFKKVYMPELLTQEERGDGDSDESGSEEEESDVESETEGDSDDSIHDFIVPDGFEEEEGDEPTDADVQTSVKKEGIKEEEDGVAGPSCLAGSANGLKKAKKSKGEGKRQSKGKGKAKAKGKKPKSGTTLAELKKLATRNKSAKKAYLRRLRKDYVSSAKIDKTMEILREIMEDKEGEKVLIFSQWTSLLDLLEIPIDKAGIGYRRYDGSMSAALRGDAVDDFRDESKNVRVMLISLKAGNAGLNLNMASQVIILDPFWNPYIEEQAVDRAHRFGQMRPVKVHRLLIQETVEDRIIALQEKKRALISEALDENQANAISRLGVQELAYLFGVTHDPSQRVNYVPRDSNRR